MRWRRRRRRPRAARRGHPPPPLPLHLPPPLPVLLLYRSSCAPVLQETLGASARGPQLRALFLCAGSSAPQLDVAVAGPSTQGSAAAAATPSHPLLASLSVRTGSATRYGWIWCWPLHPCSSGGDAESSPPRFSLGAHRLSHQPISAAAAGKASWIGSSPKNT